MNTIEMHGFLTGKCLPGDMRVNETTAEYLVRKFREKDQQLAAVVAERDALAAECAAQKSNLMFWDADNPESPYDSPEEIANDLALDYNDELEVQVAARLHNRKYRVCETWDWECKLELVEGSEVETPATDAALAAIRDKSRAEGINFAANRLLAAFEHGFIDKPAGEVADVAKMILSAVTELPGATEDDFTRDYSDEVIALIHVELREASND